MTRSWGTEPPSGFPPRVHDGHPPSLHRVPAVWVPLLQRYYEDARLPASLSPRFVSFAWRYQAARLSFRSLRSRTHNRGPGVHYPVPTAGPLRLETIRASQVPGKPWCACALLFDPGEPALPGHYGSAARPHAHSTTRALHERYFRGSITRHRHSLSTLRPVGRPKGRKTRFWLPASSTRRDWLPAGFLRKVSVMFLTSLSPFPSFLAQ